MRRVSGARDTLRLGRVLLGSRTNGPGLRDVYWVTGCSILCPGCVNPHLLDATTGVDVTLSAIEELLAKRVGEVEGITISGGEPTDQPEGVARLAAAAWALRLSVVVFTGRSLFECERRAELEPLLRHCDVLVAGPFVAGLRQRSGPLLASANQRVHFLSGRYREEGLGDVPDLELLVGERVFQPNSYLYKRIRRKTP